MLGDGIVHLVRPNDIWLRVEIVRDFRVKHNAVAVVDQEVVLGKRQHRPKVIGLPVKTVLSDVGALAAEVVRDARVVDLRFAVLG